jgi:benzoate membrane transport protein
VVTISNSLKTATEEEGLRVPAIVTFLTTTSGIVVFGIGSAFWALLTGVLFWVVTRRIPKAASRL